MIQDKNFNLFLLDGTAQGKISCKTENWAGVAFKIPKTQIENCAEIKELNHAGIYFLFSESTVYIGAGKLKSDADFWNDAIFFTYQKKSFEMMDLKFLKDKFTKKIAAANRYELKSGNEIFPENIGVEKKSSLELFASYIENILYIFGYKVFEPLEEISAAPQFDTPTAPSTADNPIFYLVRNVKGLPVFGKCQKIFTKFVVLKGSKLAPEVSKKGIAQIVKDERKKAKISEDFILLEEVFLDSASAAGSFVTGTSTQGTTAWQTENGMTIAEFLESQPAEE